jgi:uroporphyrinogen-III synthase
MILITRPVPTAYRTERLFKNAGFDTLIAPSSSVEYLNCFPFIDMYDAVIISSSHALEKIEAGRIIHTPLMCAGGSSAQYAKQKGFQHIFRPTLPGVEGICAHLHCVPYNKILYIRGDVISFDLWDYMRTQTNIHCDEYIHYRIKPVASWPETVVDVFRKSQVCAITFFSESTTEMTKSLLLHHNMINQTHTITALCLSQTIASHLEPAKWKNIIVGSTVNELIANLR